MDENSLAVVILNWNGLAHLQRFLGSVVKHWQSATVHIVVADNGSSDESIAWVQEHYPEVFTVVLDQNYGFAEGYQRALAWVRNHLGCPFYLLLNNDVEVTHNFLPKALVRFLYNPTLAVLAPKILSLHAPQSFEYAGAAGGYLDRYGYPFCRGRILGHLEEDCAQYDERVPLHWASGACFLVRATAYWQVGGLDERFFAHMEEVDFCWRLLRKGWQIESFPQGAVLHLGGGTLPNESPRKLYLNYRNSLWMLRRNLAPRHRGRLWMRHVLDGLSAIVFFLTGRWAQCGAVRKAYRDYWSQRSSYNYEPYEGEKPVELWQHSILWAYYVRQQRTWKALQGTKEPFTKK